MRSGECRVAGPRVAAGRRLRAGLALALAIGALVPLASRCAAGDDEYRYVVEPGDTIYGVSHRLLEDPSRWPQLQRSNGVRWPKRLQPGQVLTIPVDWLRREDQQATVVVVEGAARAERGGAAVPLTAGSTLLPGTRIATGNPGSVLLRLADGTTLQLQSATDFELRRLQRLLQTSTYDDQLRVGSGRVAVGASARSGPGARLEIVTPRAVAGVRGTEFRVGAIEETSLLEVLGGSVGSRSASGSGATLGVTAGEGVAYDGTSETPRVVKLLPAPVFELQATPFTDTPAAIGFAPVAGAAAYRAQIALDDRFSRVIDERVVGNPPFTTAELPDGRYWIRVRAIAPERLEGHDADATFAIAAKPRPPISMFDPEWGRVPGPSVRIAWTKVPDAAAYHFQLARESDLRTPLRDEAALAATETSVDLPLADADYHWRVASIDGRGKRGPWSDVFRLERRPQPAKLGAPNADDEKVVLRWSGAEGVSYRVAIATREDFAGEAAEYTVNEPLLTVPRPAPGRYFVRVRLQDAAGSGGPWSDPQQFEIPTDYRPLLLLLLLIPLVF